MVDALAFLDEPDPEIEGTATVVTTPAKVEEPAPKVEIPAPAKVETPVVAAAPVKVETPTPDADGDKKTVPLRTFLDMVDENKDLKNQLKGGAKTPEEEIGFEVPDPDKNPKEYRAYQETMTAMNLLNMKMDNSERFARLQYKDTPDLVNKARDWALERMKTDDTFGDKIYGHSDPYAEAIRLYNEDVELQDYRAWKADKGKNPNPPLTDGKTPVVETPVKTEVVVRAAAATPQPVKEEIPGSIADETSAGKGHATLPTGPGRAFDTLFPDVG